MSKFGKLTLTQKGINALIKAQLGEQLVFSKIKMGDAFPLVSDYAYLTDVANETLSADIINGKLVGSTYTVEAMFTNSGLTEEFYWRELGVYIQDSNGNDILFGYANSGTNADFIPATSSEIYTKNVKIAIATGGAQNITFSYPSQAYVTLDVLTEDLETKVDKVDGMGLSTNDYSNEEKNKLAKVIEDLANYQKTITESINTLNLSLEGYATDTELKTAKEDLTNAMNGAVKLLQEADEEINTKITNINTALGTADISSIGDGTIKGAISALYTMITNLPAVTSGTTEPTGGKDGDLYVMYE